jgi:predicted secreted protein
LKVNERLLALDEETRRSFCREVLERMSELVEEEAPDDFCDRVIALLGDCPCYDNYKSTLEETILLARECGERSRERPAIDEQSFQACVARVKEQLQES